MKWKDGKFFELILFVFYNRPLVRLLLAKTQKQSMFLTILGL